MCNLASIQGMDDKLMNKNNCPEVYVDPDSKLVSKVCLKCEKIIDKITPVIMEVEEEYYREQKRKKEAMKILKKLN